MENYRLIKSYKGVSVNVYCHTFFLENLGLSYSTIRRIISKFEKEKNVSVPEIFSSIDIVKRTYGVDIIGVGIGFCDIIFSKDF
jgi:hypothetical protein